MYKRGSKWIWVSLIIVVILLIVVGVVYYFLANREGSAGTSVILLQNPAAGLAFEQAVASFNESFVLYLLYNIGANKLHNFLFSDDEPKIEIFVENVVYNAIVEKGNIKVGKGEIEEEDIKIKTSREEAVRMMNDKSYIEKSFQNGNSQIELVAGKTKLFLKGYLGLYEDLTGKSAE